MSASASSSGESGVGHQPRAACSAGKQEQVPDLPWGAKPDGGTVCAGVTGTTASLAAPVLCCCGRAPGGWALATRSRCWAFFISHDPFVFPTVCALTLGFFFFKHFILASLLLFKHGVF